MTARKAPASAPAQRWRAFAGLTLLALAACSALRPTATPPATLYALDNPPDVVCAPAPQSAPTLLIHPPHATAGFDSQRIIYVREPHKREYFAHSEWVDPPARMLEAPLVAALQNTCAFHAVVLLPNTAQGDVRLDTEIIRLQQAFLTQPSHVRFTLRATLVDDKTRSVLAWREFDTSVVAASDDPAGGVVAANRAVQTVLKALAEFCAELAHRPAPDPDPAHF